MRRSDALAEPPVPPESRSPLAAAAQIAADFESAGYDPVLVGGMALVILGSQRVTKDFDLLVSTAGPPAEGIVDILYRRHCELVTRLSSEGEVRRTIDNARVAAVKLKAESLRNLTFFEWNSRLRIDLLLDFPLPARDVVRRATKVSVGSRFIRVAAREDLLRLKEIALAGRHSPADAQDLEFLRRLAGS